MNDQRISISWDVDKINSDEIDDVFEDITNRIEYHFEIDVGELKLRVGVYDGTDFHHKEQIIGNRQL